MYILTLRGKEDRGAYSVINSEGEQVLYIFEEEDDANRFSLWLENDDYPPLNVIEVDKELIIKTCNMHRYQYAIITQDDIVIPPEQNDFI
jgi:hypothetical protein